MNKVASYLQSHISGEVLTNPGALNFFSTDASVLELKPSYIAYPRTTNDVRKIARFSWQLAEKGHKLAITARGSGTDQTGAAISNGLVMVFPAHLNRILELDTKDKLVRVQPGVNFKSLQETLHTHGLFLPPYPASYAYSTIGGAIGNNTAGEKSLKYGSMRDWVEKLEVVLANGEVIQTERISAKELDKRKGLATLEGEIYRAVDGVLGDHEEALSAYNKNLHVTKNSVGYALSDIKHKDGSFDLTPLFVGSQGTLGIITEAIIKVAPYTPNAELMVASFETLDQLIDAVDSLRPLEPSALEMIDGNLITFARKHQSLNVPEDLLTDEKDVPAGVLFVEFDDVTDRVRHKKAKKARKILEAAASMLVESTDPEEQERLWALRHIAATVTNYDTGGKAALPIIEDGVVPQAALHQLIEGVYALFKKHHLDVALWGHVGDANLHMQPIMDLSKLGDRQKVFKVMDEYYALVNSLGGSIAAEHNDGRLRAPFVERQVGSDVIAAYVAIKQGCDSLGVLNPGVKTGTDVKDLVELLRHEYSLAHLADHLPRT